MARQHTPTSTTHRSACPLDCPDACTLEVEMTDGRVTRLDGTRQNPFTAGFLCSKVRHFDRHLYGDERVHEPSVRDGAKGTGAFRPVSWNEALSRVVDGLEAARARHGGESILPFYYGGSNGFLTQGTVDARLFHRLGASRLLRTVCAMPSSIAAAGLYGKMVGTDFADYGHAALIVVWGTNPAATGIHLVPVLDRARARGARLVVVDPRRTREAGKADLHLAPRPGTDLPLALALHRWLFESGRADLGFLAEHATGVEELRARAAEWTVERAAEECGLEADDVRAFAELYADSSPAVIRCGWGAERNRNGTSAIAAILALPAVAGKFGVRGGGYTMSNGRAWSLDSATAARAAAPGTRAVNMNRLGRTLLEGRDPPIAALFVYDANPLATIPNQRLVRRGLEREDLFTVVFDQVWTDTARYADVVLPATTFLEHTELHRGYGSPALRLAPPVVPPVGGARSNYDVFAELCERLGLAQPGDPTGPDALVEAIVDGHLDRGRAARLRDEGQLLPGDGGPAPVAFRDGHLPLTSDGKVHLVPAELDAASERGLYAYLPDPATEAFPLALISPATSRTVSSTLGQLVEGPVPLTLHPDDAAPRSIRSGDRVRVFNELGEVLCPAQIDDGVRSGTVVYPKGVWCRNSENGETSNALSPDTLSDVAGGACFNDARVEVERAPSTRAGADG